MKDAEKTGTGVIAELTEYRQELVAQEASLQSELERVKRLIESTDMMLQDYPRRRRSGKANPRTEVEPDGRPLTVQDIAHCNTQMDAIREIAHLSGGYLRPRQAARLLIESRLTSSSSIDSVGATIYRRIKDKSDWERHRAGIYRYLPFFAQGAESGDVSASCPCPAGPPFEIDMDGPS